MRADDVAARCGDRRVLLAAVLAMGVGMAGAPVPAAWLAATGGVVAARVRRLAEPPPRARWMRHALALAALTCVIAAAAALVPALAVTGIWHLRPAARPWPRHWN